MKAHDFTLPDQDNALHSLSHYRGKWVLLYFYPKDHTPGCIKEACTFRDAIEKFKKLNVVILGISKDSVQSHKGFHNTYQLPFPILSDTSKDTIRAYGAWNGITTKRMTFLINQIGEIVKVYHKVDPSVHAIEIIKDMQAL